SLPTRRSSDLGGHLRTSGLLKRLQNGHCFFGLAVRKIYVGEVEAVAFVTRVDGNRLPHCFQGFCGIAGSALREREQCVRIGETRIQTNGSLEFSRQRGNIDLGPE